MQAALSPMAGRVQSSPTHASRRSIDIPAPKRARRVAVLPPKRFRKLSWLAIPDRRRRLTNRPASIKELRRLLHPDAAQVAAEVAAARFCERAL